MKKRLHILFGILIVLGFVIPLSIQLARKMLGIQLSFPDMSMYWTNVSLAILAIPFWFVCVFGV